MLAIVIDKSPVKVDIKIEDIQLQNGAFYTVCFIVEDDIAPRTLEVTKLKQLLDAGYMRVSEAYNFAYSVFAQRKMEKVVIRAKRTNESYKEAYDADDNSNYYYVSIASKDIGEILDFNDHLNNEQFKLQFFSLNSDVSQMVSDKKSLVYYYQEVFNPIGLPYSDGKGVWQWDNTNNVQWDEYQYIQFEKFDMTESVAQNIFSNYPEAAWIGYCGFYFPSRVQWLHKFLAKVSTTSRHDIPELSTTSALMYNKDKATTGSGALTDGTRIEYKIMTDWLIWAIQRNLWKVLYKQEKIPQTRYGDLIMENSLKEVLDVAVSENHFSSYRITEIKQDRRTNKLSIKFSATLVHTVLGVDKVEGTVYN